MSGRDRIIAVISTLVLAIALLATAILANIAIAHVTSPPPRLVLVSASHKPIMNPVQRPRGTWRWPLDGQPTVVTDFDPPIESWLSGHRGVDLSAHPGASVRSPGAGVVRFAGHIAGKPVISVDHAGGLRTTYEPVIAVVPIGKILEIGEQIGVVVAGHPSCPTMTCLHWGLRTTTEYFNPLILLFFPRIRLLPLTNP